MILKELEQKSMAVISYNFSHDTVPVHKWHKSIVGRFYFKNKNKISIFQPHQEDFGVLGEC